MAWARLDDKRADNAKLMAAGLEARGLDEAAICWCAGHETDGFIPTTAVAMLGAGHGCKNPGRVAAKLVAVGRWDVVEQGWQIHDYLEFNQSRKDAELKREADRDRQSKQRAKGSKSVMNGNGGRFESLADNDGVTAVSQRDNGVTPDGIVSESPGESQRVSPLARPDPTRPKQQQAGGVTHDNAESSRAAALEAPPEIRTQALEILVERRVLTHTGPIPNPSGYRRGTLSGLRKDYADTLDSLDLSTFTDAQQLADHLEPPPPPKRLDPLEKTAAAQAVALAEQDLPQCETCGKRGRHAVWCTPAEALT